MTRDEALKMLALYCVKCHNVQSRMVPHLQPVVADAAKMLARFPKDGSEAKAMRWLGYIQGVVVTSGLYTLEQVKAHSAQKRLWPNCREGDARGK